MKSFGGCIDQAHQSTKCMFCETFCLDLIAEVLDSVKIWENGQISVVVHPSSFVTVCV